MLSENDRLASNNLHPGYTTLSAAITSTAATSITVVATGTPDGFPTASFKIMIDAEQMTVTAGFGTGTWTVTRAVGGTTAATHASGAFVFQCATTVIPIEPVFFEPFVNRYQPALMRNSFERFYESMIVSQESQVKGVKLPATYEVLTWLFAYAFKGLKTPAVSGQVATWAFTPTLSTDDLLGAGMEFFNDTASYHMAGMYCNQIVIEFIRGSDAAMVTVDFAGQQAFAMSAKTPGLSTPISPVDTELNMLNPALTSAYLDTTTIGTTLSNDLVSAKITIANGFNLLYFLNGFFYPTAVARPTRTAALEVVQWFDSATELANAMNTVGNGVKRKIRLQTTGPTIGTSGTANSFLFDWYGYWKTFPFKVDKEVWHVTFTGDSVYDPSPADSWSSTLVNGLVGGLP